MQLVLLYIKLRSATMALTLRPYDLPDAHVFNSDGGGFMLWKPADTCIVLGQSNTPERSLFTENVLADNVPVTRRPTGGEAVIVTPSMMMITVAREFEGMPSPAAFFREVNDAIIHILSGTGVHDLHLRGISDIAIGHRKILGSAMHRRNQRLVYHAVLNMAENPVIFERYLRHPSREPDYRSGRTHSSFVTSLAEAGYSPDTEELMDELGPYLAAIAGDLVSDYAL